MSSFAQAFTASSIGRVLFRGVIKPFLNFYRRFVDPDVPLDQRATQVHVNGQRRRLFGRRAVPCDRDVISQVFEQRQYEFPIGVHGQFLQRRYNEILASGSQPLIIDCGANIGASVVWFSLRYPEAHVVAVEPEAGNFNMLRLNTAGLNVDARQVGIAPVDGEAHLLDASTGWGCRFGQDADGPVTPIVSVATLLAQKPAPAYTPFLLKIDIEGGESSLFEGDCTAMGRFPLIILEPHDWLFPGQSSSSSFFRFHAATGREFCMKDENVASIICDPQLAKATSGFTNGF